jgi:ankyrin repeat protein
LLAAKGGHKAIVKLLLEISKAKVDFIDNNGRTLLLKAARGGYLEIIKRLL